MLELDFAGLCEQGPVRPNNEDFITHCCPAEENGVPGRGALFVVADGVGGSRAGEVASKEAAERLLQYYYVSSRKARRALQDAFTQSNLHVYDLSLTHAEYRRMQTTLTGLLLVGHTAHLGHVGDSRIYRVRGGAIEQLTNDHSEVGELVRMSIITAEDARHHPRRNVITRTIGGELLLKPDFRVEPLETGDIFVLCTDGLWEPVEEDVIAEIASSYPAEEACRRLIDLAIDRGATDNISIQTIKVLGLGPRPPETDGNKQGLLRRAIRLIGNRE